MIPAGAYPMQFDPATQYFNHYAAAAYHPLNASVYGTPPNTNYYPDYVAKSDSNSDDSIQDSSRSDPKASPKYREKRNRNNEAAKKSRINRKNREKCLQDENQKLKVQLREAEQVIDDLKKKLSQFTNGGYNDMDFKTISSYNPLVPPVKYEGLRESTNQQHCVDPFPFTFPNQEIS